MTSLEHLNLAGYTEGECHLGALGKSTFVNLSHLKILNISDCNIVGPYANENETFTPLRNLKTLDISYNRVLGFEKLGKILSGLKHSDLKILNISAVVSRYSKGIDVNASMVQSLPRSITHLVARENCFETVLDDAFDYIPENLTHLDLGINRFLFGEYLQKVWKLENLLSLDLNGADNSFGEYMAALDEEDKIFQNLSTLTTFDMSNCQLTNMPNNILAGMVNLENLHLEKNKMWIFNVSISHMPNLTLLNLSHSQINNLLPTTRQSIDRLCTPKSCQIRVDLSHCPIICECNNLDFLKWMVNSKAFEPSFHNYMCKFADSSSKYINDSYHENLRLLDLECESHIVLFLAISSATFILFCCIFAYIVYKFRWSVKYFYYAVLYKFNHQHENNANEFRYDVFISYSSIDDDFIVHTVNKELRDRGLKLHVHGRDFVTGNWIAANIVTAIKESRKTLVILTRNLLTSKWCNYEIQMANMESIDRGRPTLVFLLKESIPSKELGHDLLCHIKRNTYISYPQPDDTTNDSVYRVFWNKLAEDLKR
ncbi:toll-like receptor 4 [Physella acuta]|uniref:toll-like receptor 4 n=1 Tax=Physella acuta TaxID=109671 RepID=UPI0027DC475F|nr:toll-like receptor 4 [Physella acuta]